MNGAAWPPLHLTCAQPKMVVASRSADTRECLLCVGPRRSKEPSDSPPAAARGGERWRREKAEPCWGGLCPGALPRRHPPPTHPPPARTHPAARLPGGGWGPLPAPPAIEEQQEDSRPIAPQSTKPSGERGCPLDSIPAHYSCRRSQSTHPCRGGLAPPPTPLRLCPPSMGSGQKMSRRWRRGGRRVRRW